MSTPHNNAEKGDFAKTVLMPGDPLRAKFIAEHFLENPKLVSSVRNILAYTGTYEGKPVSVMASGMGMPSIGIYSYELYKFYEVENIIRIGSAGAYTADLNLFDVVLATGSYSESTFALCQSGDPDDTQYPSEKLNDTIRAAAAKLGIPLHEGTIHSGDVFYAEPGAVDENKIICEKHCLCAEMESFALFHNAKVLGKNAACLLTISDSLVTHAETTAEERQNSFTQMMKVALETAVQLDQE
ncbi:purine-nucleoside phosphorylase [Anaerolactibacter massiliensis]|uniref:purine-nucleoside phosphorylase n=1 Tax=Anaerolactibacter massiliensis TaxID=2044573 RepID=UPI000CFA5997|nr:purine-nucleoside phosphorylase [Anaerolactibacter massiliensis]